jgi:hypothetical protein
MSETDPSRSSGSLRLRDVEYVIGDFNGAETYLAGLGSAEWRDLAEVVSAMTLQLQASDQAGRNHAPIFDPKATNQYLTQATSNFGWSKIPVPRDLTGFGVDWDAGKNETLSEFQFSNYPFLWNNIIRTEGVFRSRTPLQYMHSVQAIVIIMKSGMFPASNSTLFYEQARAQVGAAAGFNAFTVPIRLVGLVLPKETHDVEVDWNEYPARYGRQASQTTRRVMTVTWSRAARKHGNLAVTFSPA